MRLLKQIVFSLVAFSLILLFISLLLPSRIRVSKSILTHVSKERVMSSLLNVDDWKNWNPILQDSNIAYEILSPTEVRWKAENGISNSITLKQYAEDSVMAYIVSDDKQVFSSGFTVVSNNQDTSLTKVEWWIDENIKWYPWEKFYGLFSESFRETYMENNLKLFKLHIEDKFIPVVGKPH
ncbi:MAG TPA: hypothetical protein VFV68_17285 [Agriterribacter sp.]|nr:hypothetical protein [Agriterribacter sp.]